LQYVYPDDPQIKGAPHKNSKLESFSAAYNRSKKSVLSKIKEQANDLSAPTAIYNKVFEECGGVLNANSCGSLPRNRKQISNLKRTIKSEPIVKDPLFAVMEQCKKEQSCAEPFLRVIQAAPDAMCLLANDRQLHDFVQTLNNAPF